MNEMKIAIESKIRIYETEDRNFKVIQSEEEKKNQKE